VITNGWYGHIREIKEHDGASNGQMDCLKFLLKMDLGLYLNGYLDVWIISMKMDVISQCPKLIEYLHFMGLYICLSFQGLKIHPEKISEYIYTRREWRNSTSERD